MKPTHSSLTLPDRLREYARLMRVDRPIGMLLLLWPTLWALWLAAEGWPEPKNLLVFVLGVAIMRSAGCVINDYADRDVDPHVARTRLRPLAARRIPPHEALILFALLCLVAFALVLLTNGLTILLSIVGAVLATTYPFMKRVTHLPQIYLGAAFGWAVPMAFAAETQTVPSIAWVLLLTTLCWAVAYDTMYAMVDREDDRRVGVKSTAILFGSWDRALIGTFQLFVLMLLVVVGRLAALETTYYLGLVAAAGLFGYQQVLIRDRDETRCFKAFLNNNLVGLVIFAGIALGYLVTAR